MISNTSNGWFSGWNDLLNSLQRHELWLYLGWQDIRQRYRRSVLGPFWLTISSGIQIGTLGFLWAALFGQGIAEFLPFFATGLLLWTLLSGVLLEACTGFTQYEAIIRQVKLPFSTYLLRILCKHVIIFAHNLVIIAIVLLSVGRGLTPTALLFLPGLLLLAAFALFMAGPIAVFCTRFRDMPQILINLINVLYYFTPIMWMPKTLQRMPWIYEWNPLHHLFQIVRAPILGEVPSQQDYVWALSTTVLAALLFLHLLGRFRHRIAYWI